MLLAMTGLSGETELRCVITRFSIDNGKADIESLLIVTPKMVIAGDGVIDLGAETVDIVFQADKRRFVPTGLAIPVRIHGALSEPKVDTDLEGFVGDLVLTAGELVLAPMVLLPLTAGILSRQLMEPGGASACTDTQLR